MHISRNCPTELAQVTQEYYVFYELGQLHRFLEKEERFDDIVTDTVGWDIWDGATISLCEKLAKNPQLVRGKTVLELGAGVGVVGQPHVMVRFMTMDRPQDIHRVRVYYYAWYVAFYTLTVLAGLAWDSAAQQARTA